MLSFAGNNDDGPADLSAGQVIAGKYRILDRLGRGGMGIVVSATHEELHQKVAVKFLLSDATEARTRFMREAQIAARFKNAHVVRILDVGKLESDVPYIVMEHLDGQDLEAFCAKRGRLEIQEAVGYILQICDALAEAHVGGIVHRDLKLANVFLTKEKDGSKTVKLLDFGISKILDVQQKWDSAVTETSAIIGSPNYMAPEQLASASEVDERADIWSAGVVLYRMLTGKNAFDGTTLQQVFAGILNVHPRSVHSLREDVSPDLSRVVDRCLEKDPAARFPSVAELALALRPHAAPAAQALVDRIVRVMDVEPLTESVGALAVSADAAAPQAAPETAGVNYGMSLNVGKSAPASAPSTPFSGSKEARTTDETLSDQPTLAAPLQSFRPAAPTNDPGATEPPRGRSAFTWLAGLVAIGVLGIFALRFIRSEATTGTTSSKVTEGPAATKPTEPASPAQMASERPASPLLPSTDIPPTPSTRTVRPTTTRTNPNGRTSGTSTKTTATGQPSSNLSIERDNFGGRK